MRLGKETGNSTEVTKVDAFLGGLTILIDGDEALVGVVGLTAGESPPMPLTDWCLGVLTRMQ